MLSGPKAACACPIARAFCAKSGNGSTQSRPCGELLIFATRTVFPASFNAFANSRSFASSSVSESKMSRPSTLGCSALAALTTSASKERFHGHRPYRSRLSTAIAHTVPDLRRQSVSAQHEAKYLGSLVDENTCLLFGE